MAKHTTMGQQRASTRKLIIATIVIVGVFELTILSYLNLMTSRIFSEPTVPGKNIVSYSLYGSNPRYTDGTANAQKMKLIYQEWTMRVYHDNTVPSDIIRKLHNEGVELVNMTSSTLKNPMVWRFLVASDRTVGRYLMRDIDSRVSLREKAAVDDWIESGKEFHIMRDNPFHTMTMLGGLWGGTRDAFPQMAEILYRYQLDGSYNNDQLFLNDLVWPIAKHSALQHDSFTCEKFGGKPFPTARVGTEYVGSVFINGSSDQIGRAH
eukprot:43813_1